MGDMSQHSLQDWGQDSQTGPASKKQRRRGKATLGSSVWKHRHGWRRREELERKDGVCGCRSERASVPRARARSQREGDEP